jgi:hypothetical protein
VVEITPDALGRLLVARGVPRGLDPAGLLEAARRPEHRLAVTLLGAWEAQGEDLDGAARRVLSARRDELAGHRARLERYAGTWELIRGVAPDAYTVKGLEIAALYPTGVVRQGGDLDVACERLGDVWRVALLLEGQGWTVDMFTALRLGGADGRNEETAVVVAMALAAEDPERFDDYAVEVSTVALTGNVWRPEQRSVPHARDAPMVKNVVALLAERVERRFTSRDLLDLALLLDRIDRTDRIERIDRTEQIDQADRIEQGHRAVLDDGLERAGMWPEWHEAVTQLAELDRRSGLGLLPAGFDPAASAGRARAARLRRAARATATLAHPLKAVTYWTQARLVDEREHPVADRVSRLLGERVGGERLLRHGLPLFGVPLDPARRTPELRLERRGRHLVATSPVGSFLLVAGVADASWLEEAQR